MTEERRRYDPRITTLTVASEAAAKEAAKASNLATTLAERVAHMHDCVEELKHIANENRETLADVKAILASFRVVGAVAKWCAGGATAGTAIMLFWRNLNGG